MTTKITKLIGLGRAAAAKTFTRNNNRRSNHATAGKLVNRVSNDALLRSSSLANPTNQPHPPTTHPRSITRARIYAPLIAILALLAFAATPAMAEFGLQRFAFSARNQNGTPDTQAGSHPYALNTTFLLNLPNEGNLKDVKLELPPGFVGDPNATPHCTYQQFIKYAHGKNECPNETVIGVSTTYLEVASTGEIYPTEDPVYNLVPPTGVAAQFGFLIVGEVPVFLDSGVRTGADYGLNVTVPDISQAALVVASKVTIWGVPAAPSHNLYRGSCLGTVGGEVPPSIEAPNFGLREGQDELEGPNGPNGSLDPVQPISPQIEAEGGCKTQTPLTPLLTNPTSCGTPRTATLSVDDWEQPGVYHSKSTSMPEIAGCETLDFSPTLEVKPDTPDASTSSGVTVNVKVPQESTQNPVGLGEADVRDATVVLPPGVALNPAGANGLQACSADPSALSAGQLGSPGDGIGYEGSREFSSQPGSSVPTFTPSLPGSIAAGNAASTGALASSENLLQPGLNFCSNASKIGTVKIKTPLLPNELTGNVYLAAQEANPFSSLLAMYAVVEDPVSGVLVKFAGEVTLCKGAGEVIAGQTCQALGQIVTTFLNTPQAPVEEVELHFFGGEKAPLTTPSRCGTYTTQTSFQSWAGQTKNPSSEFQIEHGVGGSTSGACPGSSLPFSPSLTGGALNLNAGAFSPFTATMSRGDGEQNIQSLEVHLPPGLAGILTGVELCPEPQANQGLCGPNSLIGETTVSVGVGGDPYTVSGGKFYLTGPYNGSGGCTVGQANCAPFGITFEVPAKAGPFDLAHTKSFSPACDCILVRGKIEVNPLTAAITITSNPPGTPSSIPTSIEGIPLEIQKINATTTRGNFQFNPTNCSKMEVTGTIHSAENATDTIGVPFQVTNCAALKFEPKLAVSTQAKTSKANGASLTFKFTNPNAPQGTQANYHYFKVELPEQLPSRLTTLQKACTAKQFDENPAGCPTASIVGHMVVHTPVLPVPLEGPLYFVSNGGEAFPNLIVVLQGYGVTTHLIGDTFISKTGVTSSTFKTIPDFPFTTAEVILPEGPYSALAANGNLCAETKTVLAKKKVTVKVKGHRKTITRKVKETQPVALQMPTEFIAQNGLAIHQTTPIRVTGCAKKIVHPAKKKKSKQRGKKGGKR